MNKLYRLLLLTTAVSLLGVSQLASSDPLDNVTSTAGLPDAGIDGQPVRKKKIPPPPPPQKTKYDKLPLAKLMAKAEKGDLTAEFELGSRFNYGRSVPKDTAQALHWLRKAAKAGDPNAARLLAVKFYNGFDVEPDYAEAIKWAEKLAETHDVSAALMLGSMYANGEGNTKRDLPRSYMWYAIGAGNEPVDEEDPEITDEELNNNALISTAQEERDKIAGLISAREEKIGQRNASEWWLRHPVPVKKKGPQTASMNAPDSKVMQVAPAPATTSGFASH
ncbi:MAG TPA: tetratricopeptide repeat protein [Methylophilaceae bacterium]|jgi:hypothetical protein